MPDHANLSERYALLERLAPGGAEDFITEVFCWILQQEDVGKAFLEFLEEQTRQHGTDTNNITDIISGIKEDECSWSTQESYRISSGVKRPDMICECESGKQALVFEHKVWAKLHTDQLKNYREIGKEEYGNDKFAIVLITARRYQKEQNPDLHFLWSDVYDWLNEWLRKRLPDSASNTDADDANLEFVCRNFLTLLEQRGLGPMPSIRDKHFEAFGYMRDAEEGRQRIRGLLNVVANDFEWETNLLALKERGQDVANTSRKIRDHWGRIDFNLLNDWKPNIVVCILTGWGDGWGLDDLHACVMLDLDKTLWGLYYKEYHDKLFKFLKKGEEKLKKGWGICDDRKVSESHPIGIRRKLEDILLPELPGEQQADALLKEMKSAVELIVNQDMFWEMRENMKRAADRLTR